MESRGVRVADIPMRGGDIPCNAHPDPSESDDEDIPVDVGMYPYEAPVSGEKDVLRGWIYISINAPREEANCEGDISTALNFLLGNEGNDRPHLIRGENKAIGEVLSRSSPRPVPFGRFPPSEDGSPSGNANIAEVTEPSFARNSEAYEVDIVDLGRPFGPESDVSRETDGLLPPPHTPVGEDSIPCRRPPTPARSRSVSDRRALPCRRSEISGAAFSQSCQATRGGGCW